MKSKRMKQFRDKIESRKEREKSVHELAWVYENLRELSDYLETGENTSLREKCWHSIRHLVAWAKKNNPRFQLPWYCYCN